MRSWHWNVNKPLCRSRARTYVPLCRTNTVVSHLSTLHWCWLPLCRYARYINTKRIFDICRQRSITSVTICLTCSMRVIWYDGIDLLSSIQKRISVTFDYLQSKVKSETGNLYIWKAEILRENVLEVLVWAYQNQKAKLEYPFVNDRFHHSNSMSWDNDFDNKDFMRHPHPLPSHNFQIIFNYCLPRHSIARGFKHYTNDHLFW